MSALLADDPLHELSGDESPDSPPAALLLYQQKWVADEAQLKIAEKGRRIGLTWGEAADDALIASANDGSNVFYISAAEDMAREYIEAVAMWARAYDYAASEISEGLFDDGSDKPDPAARFIKTFEVNFPATGHRVKALSSRPTNLRGKQGVVVIDEAAFAPDLAGLQKAALAMLLHGDKVRIISTHDGVENAFNQLIQEVRAGKRGTPDKASVHRITFRDAVSQGLYKRVCLRRGRAWTQQAEDAWVSDAYKFYGDDATEELDAVPSLSAGAYLSLTLISQRMTAEPPPVGPALIRGAWKDDFAFQPEDVRRFAIDGWLREHVTPHLKTLHLDRRHVFGQDFARNRNLSVIEILEEDLNMVWRVKAQIELFNCPFTCQEQILFHCIDGMPRFRGGAMDAGGNGAALAEKTAQRYGTEMVEQVKISDMFYLQNMPKLKAGLEDGTLTDLPRDVQTQEDLRAIKLINGVPKLPRGDTAQSAAAKAAAAEGGEKLKRHGDAAIALLMAIYATSREVGEIGYMAVPPKTSAWEATDSSDDNQFESMRSGTY